MERGVPVLVRVDDDYRHGYVLEDKPERNLIKIQIHMLRQWYARDQVMVLRRGNFLPLVAPLHVPPPKPRSVLPSTAQYNKRKVRENHRLIYDALSVGIDVKNANLLALDDFPSGTKNPKLPNTARQWVSAGGRIENVYVPNPDKRVVDALNSMKGHGFHGLLSELLVSEKLPKMDTIFLDFCGFWSQNKEAVRLLFVKRVMNEDKCLIHLTTCKREGRDVVERVFEELTSWTDTFFYGRCARLHVDHSSTMFKGSFVVGKKVFG